MCIYTVHVFYYNSDWLPTPYYARLNRDHLLTHGFFHF